MLNKQLVKKDYMMLLWYKKRCPNGLNPKSWTVKNALQIY